MNWFITGQCPYHCGYCYAEDLMRERAHEPDSQKICSTAEAILKHKPLAVVLTGGEPLSSPHLGLALEQLGGSTGLIVDTNGLLLTKHHVRLFRHHGVVVRISLDSDRPRINGKFRSSCQPSWGSNPETRFHETEAAVRAINECMNAGVTVVVQSVATKESLPDLVSLGDKLMRLGIRSWRVHRVADSFTSHDGYLRALGPKRSYVHVFSEIEKAAASRWTTMSVEIAKNEVRNSVVLTASDGSFYTESNVPGNPQKIILDSRSPRSPSTKSVHEKVNLSAHAARYLNFSS